MNRLSLSLISLTTIAMTALAAGNVNAQTVPLVPSGTAYGLAVTYDFTFSKSKILGYVGPRILFVSASGNVAGVTLDVNQTNIGLIAGVDYAISDKWTAGLNVTYDVSRSGSYSVTGSTKDSKGSFSSDNGFNIGINVGYSF